MKSSLAFTVTILIVCCIVCVVCQQAEAISCDSCGRECSNACGTRHFRTCCFNYLRKRSNIPPLLSNRINPYDFADIWLARAMKNHHNAYLTDSWLNNYDTDSDMNNDIHSQGFARFPDDGKRDVKSRESTNEV